MPKSLSYAPDTVRAAFADTLDRYTHSVSHPGAKDMVSGLFAYGGPLSGMVVSSAAHLGVSRLWAEAGARCLEWDAAMRMMGCFVLVCSQFPNPDYGFDLLWRDHRNIETVLRFGTDVRDYPVKLALNALGF